MCAVMRFLFGLLADYWDFFYTIVWMIILIHFDYLDCFFWIILDYMDCMSLIILKQHLPLLLWVQSLLFSITYELDTKTPKGKLQVVPPAGDTACIPRHYWHLMALIMTLKRRPWERLSDVVCQLVGTGLIPWCLIRDEDTKLSHFGGEMWIFVIIGSIWAFKDYWDYI